MKILVNGNADLLSGDPGVSLGTLIQQIQAWAAAEGVAVLSVTVDGQSASELDLARDVGEFSDMALAVQPVGDLVQQTLGELSSLMPNLREASVEAAEGFQQGDNASGLKKMEQVLTIWTAVSDAMRSLGPLISDERSSGLDIPGEVDKLVAHLETIKTSFSQGDVVGLADLLEYEAEDRIAAWETILGTLSEASPE
jgi:hypothetical protein